MTAILRAVHVLAFALLPAAPAAARPVSYPGGWTAMAWHDGESTSALLHTTPSRHWSLGLRSERNRMDDWRFDGVQANWLVQRWNLPESQANIYLMGAAGLARADDGTDSEAGQLWFSADWEDRRFMAMYEARAIAAGDVDRSVMQMARAGFAPYVGDFGDLHTWLFVQANHAPEAKDPVGFAGIVRFFYQTVLFEAGAESDGDLILNLTLRF